LCEEVVIIAKADTALPPLSGEAAVWIEPDEPRHPLAGVVHALRTSGGRDVLVLACDMPLVPEALLRALVTAASGAGAVARCGGIAEPLCACYCQQALAGLAHFDPSSRATDVVDALGVAYIDWEDADAVLSVNAPEDLIRAQTLL
jgi:molybdopterin-guanine dinucleotide biosynthesis protein A